MLASAGLSAPLSHAPLQLKALRFTIQDKRNDLSPTLQTLPLPACALRPFAHAPCPGSSSNMNPNPRLPIFTFQGLQGCQQRHTLCQLPIIPNTANWTNEQKSSDTLATAARDLRARCSGCAGGTARAARARGARGSVGAGSARGTVDAGRTVDARSPVRARDPRHALRRERERTSVNHHKLNTTDQNNPTCRARRRQKQEHDQTAQRQGARHLAGRSGSE